MFRSDNPLSVRAKLVTSFTILCVVILIFTALLVWTQAVSRHNHTMLMEAHDNLERALELDGDINKQVGTAHVLIIGEGGQKEYDDSRNKVQAYLDEWLIGLRKRGSDASTKDFAEVRDIKREYDTINSSLNEAVSLRYENRQSDAMMKFSEVSNGYERGVLPKIRALIAADRLEVARSEANSRSASSTAGVIAWLALTLGVLVAVAVPVVLVRDVIGSLDRLRRGMRMVGKGDYDSPIEIRKRDEFGDLAEQFNKMSKDAKRLMLSENEAAAARAEAEASERHAGELKDIIDIASHELRHPATVFMAYSEILLNNSEDLDEETVSEALHAIHDASVRLSRLVSELVDTSRIERGEMRLELEAVDPWSLFKMAVQEIDETEAGARINIDRHGENREISVDPEKLKEVLVILLENALQFSPPESKIDLWYEERGNEAVFRVSDRGSSIPEEDRGRVFERFYQVGDVVNHSLPGIGLGLYIAKEIVVAHRGWISMEPREGGGSVFLFGIPTS